ncbi:hypothetical protein EDD15DRAFT_2304486 [Pisolithus albus]|nr:hypothetical protein EDD15DRAFT_2304486 [Pisolithus albus]
MMFSMRLVRQPTPCTALSLIGGARARYSIQPTQTARPISAFSSYGALPRFSSVFDPVGIWWIDRLCIPLLNINRTQYVKLRHHCSGADCLTRASRVASGQANLMGVSVNNHLSPAPACFLRGCVVGKIKCYLDSLRRSEEAEN